MSERKQLLAAICANPEEDTPRLAFADWLEEQGGEDDVARAGFVRAQIALDPLPRYHPDWLPAAHDILRRWGSKFGDWRLELPRIPGVSWGQFRRGFVDSVSVSSAKNFVQKGGRIAATVPLLGISLTDRNEFTAFGRSPVFGRLRRLQIAHGRSFTATNTQELLALPNFPRLTHLDLSTELVANDGAAAIAACPHLAGLTELRLSENHIADAGYTALAKSPHLSNLRALHIDRNIGGTTGVRALAESPNAAGLRELSLGYCGGPDGARALATSRYLTKLEDFTVNDFVVESLEATANSPNFAGLIRLRITARGAKAVAESPHMRNLRELWLIQNTTLDDAESLAKSPHLVNLRRLNLSGHILSDKGALALAESPYLGGLCEGWLFLGASPDLTQVGISALLNRFGHHPAHMPAPGGFPSLPEDVRF
ncbi:TIGR02996 domain-containing protein [Gemmata sp.]|uniref:TIGR02996 domain-containing protein n=1 Tax=Gemmata sp. TaxID=1914242 RepID=UPI003F70C688